MGGFYWVDSWLADTPNHYSLSLTTPLPSGQNVFVPGATCKDACRGWPPQATDWIVGAFWCLLALEPPAAVWSIEISPKSIPNSQKQKQLPNTQWVKYVYCPALLTLEVGRARRNHSTNTLWKNPFPKAFAILWPIFPKLVRRVFPKELLSASIFTSST